MRTFFGFLYAVFFILAIGCGVWGIGSAMMNGVRYSSLGPMLFASGISILAACVFSYLAG